MTQISKLVIYDVPAIFDRGVFELSSIVKLVHFQEVFFLTKNVWFKLAYSFSLTVLKPDCFQVPCCHLFIGVISKCSYLNIFTLFLFHVHYCSIY